MVKTAKKPASREQSIDGLIRTVAILSGYLAAVNPVLLAEAKDEIRQIHMPRERVPEMYRRSA